MAKIVLTISADNKATQSVKLLNAEVQALSKTLSTVKVDKNLTTQINALTKHYTALSKAAVRVNEATTKRQIAEQRLANEVKRGRTEDQNALKVKAQKEQAELRLKQSQDKATQSTQKQTSATKQNTEVNKEHRQSILSMAEAFAKSQVAAMLILKPLQLIRSALSSINETLVNTEDKVIALQRVLPSGSASDNEISSRLYKIAQDYGQTFENVSQIAQNFARTGMSWADTIKATEAAVLALNVAELDATEASEGLISILTQFNMETSDLTQVVDKLNKAADQNPVTTEKLLKALQRTGAAAKNANISLDDTIGIITTLSKATNRSGENLGTAVNSLIQFSSKASSLDTFAKLGGSVETAVEKYRAGAGSILEIWQELSEVIKDRQGNAEGILGGDLFGDEEWAGLNAELKAELGESYADITDIYDTASTFRKNYFIALLNDMENVKKVSGEIANANGYSQTENQKYLDTYTAKLNTLKAQWEDIANSEQGLLGIKKVFVDIGSGILTVTEWTGGLRTALLAISGIITAIFGQKIISKIEEFASKIKATQGGVLNLRKSFGDLMTAQLNSSFAADKLRLAQEQLNIAKQRGIGIEEAQAAVTKAETAVTEANTAAKKANVMAISSIITYATLAISVVSIGIGIYQQYKRKQEEATKAARQAAVSSIDDTNQTISALNDYINKLDELKKAQSEGKNVSSELTQVQNELKKTYEGVAEAIGKANNKLEDNIDLTSKAALEVAKNNASQWRLKNEKAIQNATKTVEGSAHIVYNHTSAENQLSLYEEIENALNKAGYGDFFKTGISQAQGSRNKFSFGRFTFDGKPEEIIKQIEEINKYVQDNGLGIGVSKEALEVLKLMLSETYNKINTESYRNDKEIYDYNQRVEKLLNGGTLEEFLGIQKEITEETAKQSNNIQDATGKYGNLISKLEELRDLQKESTEWEEKKLAVLEAEQALENAKNEATVRRFNEATGQWEWQTDEKKIAEAEKNLTSAKENLSDATYDEIIKMLENKTATNDKIDEIVNDAAKYLGDEFAKTIQAAFRELTGVDFTLPPNPPPSESHDNGGLALGKGFINKATDRPESVNNPDLTKKILSPVSNAEFNRYVRDMGIMFERSHEYAQVAPIIERVGGNTDNRVDNSGQINFAGGLTVGSEQRGNLLDILRTASIVPND